ncbi:methyltransferase [Roseivivax halodurans JCM 10272]|uniref:Methyltransferase n=1 Tax=Roseivivax halodurans JCM 10272 TaxID=1449350 RepID=X7EEA9_9RHOB|nr:class I SAM-dependent methyltransferase [Roseivivax halodurans]ETX14394.1 methyltransferase [Roseivivax halodurans JCM 10272]
MTAAAFWDKAAPRYARRPISDEAAYESTLARTKSYLSASATALELGCGTGTTALRLAPFVREYTATDISGAMIEIAKEKRWETSQRNLSLRQGGVAPGDYFGESYDTVLAFNLLHLVPDLAETLDMVNGLLPVRGLFISKTPAVGEKWVYRPLVTVLRAFGKAPDVTFLKVSQIDHALVAAGFELVETGLYPPSTPSRFVVARKR